VELRFFGKTTPHGKIFKIMFLKFSSWCGSTGCVQISLNLADGKLVKSCMRWENFASLSSSHYCAYRAQNLPRSTPDNDRVLQISSKSVTFGRVIPECVNTIKTGCKVFPIFDWSLALSQIITVSLAAVHETFNTFMAIYTIFVLNCILQCQKLKPGTWYQYACMLYTILRK